MPHHVEDFGLNARLVEKAGLVQEQLTRRGWKLLTAESCTGGLIGAAMTANPGSSSVYLGGVVAYANALKEALLEVPPLALVRHGAVSSEVARAMARGGLKRSGADVCLAVTGIAGPGGGSPSHPVGLVHFALAWTLTPTSRPLIASDHQTFSGDRHDIRHATALHALGMVLACCRDAS